jgi:pyoverdine/dityrosine biosynthesis protein Dit1
MLRFAERSDKGEAECGSALGACEDDDASPAEIARRILADVMRFRRLSGASDSCVGPGCPDCLAPHLAKVTSAVARGVPVTFVLPAFPGKSPNLAKVLGPLPDMAERRALIFLQGLCDRIRTAYAPGARVILCSDGRVFGDAVGMRDADVGAYHRELSKMIEASGLASISTFNLDEVYGGLSFDRMRARLMERHGDSFATLREAVRRGGKAGATIDDRESHRLYCGITRFLVEDSTFPDQKRSRTALQKECRIRAYEVIRRSKAWSEFVENRFPGAVRLSIHPQACGDKKLGIRLLEGDHWLTPWHGVAVEVGDRFILLKRADAEALGGRLVHLHGRPSHYVLSRYVLNPEKSNVQILGARHGN